MAVLIRLDQLAGVRVDHDDEEDGEFRPMRNELLAFTSGPRNGQENGAV